MTMLLDDAAFGGQVMVGAGQPIALGLGPKNKIRGSVFIEGPAQMGKSGEYLKREATLMIARTENVDCESPKRSLYVKGNVKIEGDDETNSALLVVGDVKVEGDVKAEGDVTANGGADVLSAKKDFDIPHPTKEGWRLTHACVEGPEAAVYIRGRVTNRTEIELPLYWKGLVDIQSITVNLTPIGAHQDVIIKRWDENKIYLQAKGGMPIDCFYYIMAERKDTEKLIPEYEGTIEDYPGDNSQRSIVGYHYDVKES
jgi:hypothetical protein